MTRSKISSATFSIVAQEARVDVTNVETTGQKKVD